MRSHTFQTGPISVFVVLFAALEAGLLFGGPKWWSGDDTQLLKHAIENGWLSLFFSPEAWRALSSSNLTPWVSLSFKMDWSLFGLSPTAFYVHQWISILLVFSLFYKVCRRWFSTIASLTAIIVFSLSRPMIENGEMLMLRHYVEGLVFCLAATLCFMESGKNPWILLPATLFYILACTAKEIYIPLPMVLMALPVENLRKRGIRIIPMLAFIPVYTLWRFWMLGGFGGYAKDLNWGVIARLPVAAMEAIGFLEPWSMVIIIVSLIIWVAFLNKEWKLFLGITWVATFLPILPVSDMMTERYALLPALLVGLMFGWGVSKVQRLRPLSIRGGMLLIPILFLTGQLFWGNVYHWRDHLRQGLEQMQVEGEYLLTRGKEDDFIRNPAGPSWFYEGLQWLRTHELKLSPGPQIFSDPIFFVENGIDAHRILQYDPLGKKLVEKKDFGKDLETLRAKLRPNADLTLDLDVREPLVAWKAGPWETGAYGLVFHDRVFFSIPRQGKANVIVKKDITLRLRYTAPEGWVTYSPLLTLKVRFGSGRLLWQR